MSMERAHQTLESVARNSGIRDATSAELSELRDAIHGRADRISSEDAVQLLTNSTFPNRHRDLEGVLNDDAAPSRLRYLAAVGLTRCDRQAALAILLRATAEHDSRVLAGVFRALGQIGDATAIDAIEAALTRSDSPARMLGEFARLVIEHRVGIVNSRTGTATGELLDLSADSGQRVRIRAARARVAERSLESLGARPYEIELAEAPMFEFACDRCRGTIMLNREFTGVDALSTLRKRPTLFGIGALRNDFGGRSSIAALMLTRPEPDGAALHIAIHLTNGAHIFDGRGDIRDTAVHWSLRAVRRLGAFPIRASGTFASGALRIDSAASATRVVQTARPSLIGHRDALRIVSLRGPATDGSHDAR